MPDSTETSAAGEGRGSVQLRECTYCPKPGADVCVRHYVSESGGSGHSIYAHRACAQAKGDTILWVPTTERAS